MGLAPQRGAFHGHTQYLLLGLAPLLLVGRPRGRVLALFVGAATAFVLWFYTAQYFRYGLPVVGIFCSIAGTAFVLARRADSRGTMRVIIGIHLVVLAAAGVSVRAMMADKSRDVAFGREDREHYLIQHLAWDVGGYAAIPLLNAEPHATRAFVLPGGARLYSRVRLSSPAELLAEEDEAEVLKLLDEDGFSHVMITRLFYRLPGSERWDRIAVIDEKFLRRNTALVGGGEGTDTYLYRLLPPEERGQERPWARGAELLPASGAHAGGSAPRDVAIATVPVVPGARYLLSQAARSVDEEGRARLRIIWHDGTGRELGATLEMIPVSPRAYHTFSMLATAPPGAATASVHLGAEEGEIWFADVSLRAVAPE